MKKRYLALLLVLFTVTAFGQSNFYKLSVGAGTGGTYTFTDVKKGSFAYATYANFDYNFTPFITGGLEVQMGLLKGGNRNTDPHNREFTNAYQAVMLNAKFRAGEFTDFYYSDFLNYTKGFYLGTGIGMIKNHMNKIVDRKVNSDGTIYRFPILPDSKGAIVPVNVGIDFYFPDGWGDIRYVFNINYQTNWTFGEGLDGYDDTQTIRKKIGSAPDIYNFLSVGFKYNFGAKGVTNKTIR